MKKAFFSTQLHIWLALTLNALVGTLLFGLGLLGLINEEQAHQNLKILDQAIHQSWQCRFFVADLHQQWVTRTLRQTSADPQPKDIRITSSRVDSCLNQIPVSALSAEDVRYFKEMQALKQQLLEYTPELKPAQPGVRLAPSPDAWVWDPKTQQLFSRLEQNLANFINNLDEQLDQRYNDQIQSNRTVLLVFGVAAILIIVSLTGVTLKLADKQSRLVQTLKTLARTDGLTGIANRRVWDEELKRSLERARRTRLPVTVVILDLDFFKQFNDTYGHQAGDALLQDFAQLLRSRLREGDVVARYGGEEFAMVLHGCTVTAASDVIARFRALVPYGQTFSAGITDTDGFESGATVVGRADSALYQAKHQGRNCTVMMLSGRLHPEQLDQS